MTVRDLIGGDVKVLGSAIVSQSSTTEGNFDFGTPNDINLAAEADYDPHDRILVLFSASTSGSTDTVSFKVYDAPDNNGSIGTPAAADTDGTLTGGTGDQFAITGVRLKAGRPWLRCAVDSSGSTDTFDTVCWVLAVPAAV